MVSGRFDVCFGRFRGGFWGELEGGVGAFGGDGIVLNDVLGALGGLGGVLAVLWGCWGRLNWCWVF